PETYPGPVLSSPVSKAGAVMPAPLIVQTVAPEEVPDDRDAVRPGDPVVLIVEDDPHYARVLLGMARAKGFKGVVTARGGRARNLAREYRPEAITVDTFLPDMLGWTVLSHLKQDPSTRHIPVQIITVEEERMQGLGHGAFSYLIKPTTTGELDE